jgi:hypothetical protein
MAIGWARQVVFNKTLFKDMHPDRPSDACDAGNAVLARTGRSLAASHQLPGPRSWPWGERGDGMAISHWLCLAFKCRESRPAPVSAWRRPRRFLRRKGAPAGRWFPS